MTTCRHCSKPCNTSKRGLCWPCYRKHRDLYPKRTTADDTSAEEFDRQIAERMETMPESRFPART